MNTAHEVNLEDYAIYTRSEICEQINGCDKAIRKYTAKKWEYMDTTENDLIFGDKPGLIEAIEKEIHNFAVEEMKLQSVLEMMDKY